MAEAPAHLVLVGLPGAGKSTVGAAVARRLARPFLDFDVAISQREGRSVADIFASDGEAHFRALEHALTRELAAERGMVLAPGSGWVVDPANVALLRPPARMVWLRVDPEVAVARLAASPVLRPLVQVADPLDRVRRLLAARREAFEQADVVVDTGVAPLDEVVDRVVALATGSGRV